MFLSNCRTARVIGDKLYLMATSGDKYAVGGLIEQICVLDLNRWTWSYRVPKGDAPIMCTSNTAWVHGDKIFVFGGCWKGDLGIAEDLNYPTGRRFNQWSHVEGEIGRGYRGEIV